MEQQEIWEGKAVETVEQSEEVASILGLEDVVSWKPAEQKRRRTWKDARTDANGLLEWRLRDEWKYREDFYKLCNTMVLHNCFNFKVRTCSLLISLLLLLRESQTSALKSGACSTAKLGVLMRLDISRNDSQVYMFIVFLPGWWVILLDFISNLIIENYIVIRRLLFYITRLSCDFFNQSNDYTIFSV